LIKILDKLADKDTIIRNSIEILGRSKRRKEIFALVNGKLTGVEIAQKLKIASTNCLNELALLRDFGLIRIKGYKGKSILYEKDPFIKQLKLEKYFEKKQVVLREKLYKTPTKSNLSGKKKGVRKKLYQLKTEKDVLEARRKDENQFLDFKREIIDTDKLKKEIVAFANTKNGGNIVFGIDEDKNIIGMQKDFEECDETVRQICRDGIEPPILVEFNSIIVENKKIYVLFIPPKPFNKAYMVKGGKFYIRNGTVMQEPTSEQIGKLYRGYVI
jgi:predicted HTH transcriptional regulator